MEDADYDITNIVGMDHPNYTGKTWKEAYKSMPRITGHYDSLDCDNKQHIGYFYDSKLRKTKKIDPWRIHDINNVGYAVEGSHRTAVCKLLHELDVLPKKLDGLTAVHYITFDNSTHDRYLKVRNSLSEFQEYCGYKIKLIVKTKRISETISKTITIQYKRPIYRIIFNSQILLAENGKMTKEVEMLEYCDIAELEIFINNYIKEEMTLSWKFKKKASLITNSLSRGIKKLLGSFPK